LKDCTIVKQKKLKDITFICRLSQGNTNKERVKQLPKVHTDSQNLQVAKLFQSVTIAKKLKASHRSPNPRTLLHQHHLQFAEDIDQSFTWKTSSERHKLIKQDV